MSLIGVALPVIALNLEWCGQDGPYITWNRFGGGPIPEYLQTSALNDAVAAAVNHFEQEIKPLEGPDWHRFECLFWQKVFRRLQ